MFWVTPFISELLRTEEPDNSAQTKNLLSSIQGCQRIVEIPCKRRWYITLCRLIMAGGALPAGTGHNQLHEHQEPATANDVEQQQQQQQQQLLPKSRTREQLSHPADRLAVRLSSAFSDVLAKKLQSVIHPIKAIKDRAIRKRERKDERARQRLQSILGRAWPLAAEHHDEVVKLLSKQQFLAGEVFHEPVSGHSTSPLSFLIASGAPLSVIQEVYQYSPQALHRVWPEDTYPPLMGACHSGVSHDIISFLVQECPGALYNKDFDGSLPINVYMRRSPNGPSYEVIKQMIDLYPESIIVDDNVGWGLSPIDYALRLDFDIRILELFIERWPKEENDYGLFWDSNSDFYPDTISIERVKVLMTLLPELDYFHSFIDEWSPEGLIYVLDKLAENRTVMDLCLRVPYQTLLADDAVVEALLRLLSTNTRISKLTLLGTRGQMRHARQMDDFYFNRALDAIQANPAGNLQELNLSDFSLTKGQRLAEFFLSGAAPPIFTLTDVYVSNKWVAPVCDMACRVEKFTISYCNIYKSWYQGFLSQLQSLPCLKEFVLHNGSTRVLNVTTLLCDMLKNSPLMSLKVTGYQVQTRRIVEALKNNTSLVKYCAESSVNSEYKRSLMANVMEGHNTTLEWVDLPDPKARNGIQGQRLAFYSLLNQHGRQRMRTITNEHEFVKLITDVNDVTRSALQDIAQQNVLYGLLCENPSFWCFGNTTEQEEGEMIRFEEMKEKATTLKENTGDTGRVIIDT